MSPAVLSLILVGVLTVLFIIDKIPPAVLAMTAAIVCVILKMVPATSPFAGLGGSTAVLCMSFMIIGGSLFHTGLAAKIARAFLRVSGTTEAGVMVAVMLVSAVLSSVLSNAGVVVALMPIVVKMCKDAHVPVSKGLMPLAYGASVGGILTLVGTATPQTANAILEEAGMETIGFFELAWIGVPLTLLGILYFATIGRKIVPDTGATVEGMDIYDETDMDISPRKQWTVGIIFAIVMVCMVKQPFGLPLYLIGAIGALVLVLTGCISEKDAYKSIDCPTIVIMSTMVAVSAAVTSSGGAQLIADWIVKVLGENPSPLLITTALVVVISIMTQILSNVSTIALMAPIAIAIAAGIGCNPKTLVIVAVLAANGAFMTPVGTQTFTIIYSPGKFKFKDFVKVGLPFVLINAILSIVIAPLVWPF